MIYSQIVFPHIDERIKNILKTYFHKFSTSPSLNLDKFQTIIKNNSMLNLFVFEMNINNTVIVQILR